MFREARGLFASWGGAWSWSRYGELIWGCGGIGWEGYDAHESLGEGACRVMARLIEREHITLFPHSQ